MNIDRIHHVAYRCKDAKQTVEWYVKNLGMDFVLAIAEDAVPSTGAPERDCRWAWAGTDVRCCSWIRTGPASTVWTRRTSVRSGPVRSG